MFLRRGHTIVQGLSLSGVSVHAFTAMSWSVRASRSVCRGVCGSTSSCANVQIRALARWKFFGSCRDVVVFVFSDNGPSNVATRIVLVGCKSFRFLHPGVVRYVKGVGGEVTKAGSNVLKMRPIRLTRSDIESNMNLLQATYDDPLTIIQVGLDLAERCQGYVPTTLDRRGDHPVWQKEDLIDFSYSASPGGGTVQPPAQLLSFSEIKAHADFLKDDNANQDYELEDNGEEEDFGEEEELNDEDDDLIDGGGGEPELADQAFVELRRLREIISRKKRTPGGLGRIRPMKVRVEHRGYKKHVLLLYLYMSAISL